MKYPVSLSSPTFHGAQKTHPGLGTLPPKPRTRKPRTPICFLQAFPFLRRKRAWERESQPLEELSEAHLSGTIVQCKAEAPNHFFFPHRSVFRDFVSITTPPKSNLLGSLFLELTGFFEKTGTFAFYTKVMAIL